VITNEGTLADLQTEVEHVVTNLRANLGMSRFFNGPVFLAAIAGIVGLVLMPLLHQAHLVMYA
jgi:hypothetical protein